MVNNKLTTPWYEYAAAGKGWKEYPRPQLERKTWQNLNGLYDYAVTPLEGGIPSRYDGQILVPYPIESSLSGVGRQLMPNEALYYKRSFTLEQRKGSNKILLHFGAVDYKCQVYVNGVEAGSHAGGYTPFSFDITSLVNDEVNTLIVKVQDPTDAGVQPRGKQVLNPKGLWYTATSGIWQTVWLEQVHKIHIEKLKITPRYDDSSICIHPVLSETCPGIKISGAIWDGDKSVRQFYLAPNEDNIVELPDFISWSPENPKLYDLKLVVSENGVVTDEITSYFGMRKFSIGTDDKGIKRLFLNNRPYFQKGLLDQGFWPDGLYTAPCDEALVYDIQFAKDMGFNMLRKHIKVEPARWYYHCDRLGMTVWQDMPNGGEFIGLWKASILPMFNYQKNDKNYKWFNRNNIEDHREFEKELFEMLEALYNVVSIGLYTPFNEGWGQFDAAETAVKVKNFDPTRIVDHASGWFDQKGLELCSIHRYIFSIKFPKADTRPFVLSEYGGYSCILKENSHNADKSFGYKMYAASGKLGEAYLKLHNKEVIPLIEKGLSATVYTQLSDVETEVNGLLSYDRKVKKIDQGILKKVNEKLR